MHKLGLYHIAESRYVPAYSKPQPVSTTDKKITLTHRIGSGERRGISGGERRRLSIGLELMADPAILILDEPTSGLDSVSAMKVVQVLKKLTEASDEDQTGNRKRTTVVTTIHQPSSQIFVSSHPATTVQLSDVLSERSLGSSLANTAFLRHDLRPRFRWSPDLLWACRSSCRSFRQAGARVPCRLQPRRL
jgi:hypothetical protein